jgi:hypothetical protein
VAATLGPSLVAAVAADDELLDGAWDALEGQYRRIGSSAQKRSLDFAGRIVGGLSPDQRRDYGLRQALDLDESWAWTKENLTALAKARLYTPDLTDPELGEFDPTSKVPTGLVRQAMRKAGGVKGAANLTQLNTSGEGNVWISVPDGSAPGGIATGQLIEDIIREEGGAVPGYRWVYGPADRRRPFHPHLALNGLVFASFTDERLVIHGGFPGTGHYIPGDHKGCVCDVEPIYLTPDQVERLRAAGQLPKLKAPKAPPPPPPEEPPEPEAPDHVVLLRKAVELRRAKLPGIRAKAEEAERAFAEANDRLYNKPHRNEIARRRAQNDAEDALRARNAALGDVASAEHHLAQFERELAKAEDDWRKGLAEAEALRERLGDLDAYDIPVPIDVTNLRRDVTFYERRVKLAEDQVAEALQRQAEAAARLDALPAEADLSGLSDQEWSDAKGLRRRLERELDEATFRVESRQGYLTTQREGLASATTRLPAAEAKWLAERPAVLARRLANVDDTMAALGDLDLDTNAHLRAMVRNGDIQVTLGHAEGVTPALARTQILDSMRPLGAMPAEALEMLRAARVDTAWTDGPLKTIEGLESLTGPVRETMKKGAQRLYEDVGGVQMGTPAAGVENRSAIIGMAPVKGRGTSFGAGIINHEMGHAVDTAASYHNVLRDVVDQAPRDMRSRSDPKWTRLWRKVQKDSPALGNYFRKEGHGGDASKGYSEGFAEVFSIYCLPPGERVAAFERLVEGDYHGDLARGLLRRAKNTEANAKAALAYVEDILATRGVPTASKDALKALGPDYAERLAAAGDDTPWLNRLAEIRASAG